MRTHSRKLKGSAQTQDFWPSYTDVMSTVAMILFFLMLLAYVQSILTGRRLAIFQFELEDTKTYLSQARMDLSASRKELDDSKIDLDQLMRSLEDARWNLMTTEDEISEKEDEISDKEESLKELEKEIERVRAEIAESDKLLAQSRLEVESQQGLIETSNSELGNLRAKLSEIAVMRVSILEKVSKSIEDELGKYTDTGEERVFVGPNANIVINETLLFDYASAEVKDDAKQLLDQFAIAFERILDDDKTRLYIDYISVEGHTDSAGSAGYNRSLSAERAVSVINYMMESNPVLEEKYADYFGTGGFSKFRPLDGGEGEEAMAKNRRIEISIVVKDENIRNMIDDYLGENN